MNYACSESLGQRSNARFCQTSEQSFCRQRGDRVGDQVGRGDKGPYQRVVDLHKMKRKRPGINPHWIVLGVLLIMLMLGMCCIINQLPRPIKHNGVTVGTLVHRTAVLRNGSPKNLEIAVSFDNRLDFLDSYGKVIKKLPCSFNNLDVLAYDSNRDRIYFTQIQEETTTIFRLDLNIQDQCSITSLISINSKRLSGMDFDSQTNILYFMEKKSNAIFYLPPEEKAPISLIEFENEEVLDIAINTCQQYIFWTNKNAGGPTIERANLNGTDRRVIINSSLRQPMGITVDQIDEKIYWIDDHPGYTFSISRSNFNGSDRELILEDEHQYPHSITINQDFIYWTDQQSHSVWKLNKNGKGKKDHIFHSPVVDIPNSIVSWSEQRLRLGSSCRPNLMPIFPDAPPAPRPFVLHCENGGNWNGSICVCPSEFKGLQCEFNVCKDFCMYSGKCNIDKDGMPWCQCQPGFVGTHCERDQCFDLCLHGGRCVLRPQPQCDCPEGFKGTRCEININNLDKIEKICRFTCSLPQMYSSQIIVQECNCSSQDSSLSITDELIPSNASQPLKSSSENSFSSRFLTFTMAGILIFLCFMIMLLIWRIRILSRRPRIKKRIIVNKNVTPMSDRQPSPNSGLSSTDQCEITIENCCNMNICETPCFEPQFRTPDKSSGSGKEEKKGLLGHMEEPDLTRPLHHKRHDDLF